MGKKQRGAAFVETCFLSVLILTGALAMIRFGIGLDRWSKLEACIRDGVRDSIGSRSSSVNYLAAIRSNVLARTNSQALSISPSDIHVCAIVDIPLPYPASPPPLCTTESVGTFGGAFHVTAVDRYTFFWGIPWEMDMVGEAFFLY